MAYDLGTVRGQVQLNVAQAVQAYATLRAENSATNVALRTSSQSLTRVGAGMTAVGALAIAGFAVAVRAAANFEKELSVFSAVTNANKQDMRDLRDLALQFGRQSSFSASEAVQGFVELGKAGVNAKQIIGGVGKAVLDLAQAGDVNLKTAAEDIVATMKTFNIAAQDTEHIANVLAGAANASTIDVQDLATSIKYVGGTAAAVGIPLDDLTNAIGQLGNAGIRGSTGGTALRQILLQLNPASKKAREELEKLGIIQTNGGVSAEKYASATDKQKAAIERLNAAQAHLAEVESKGQAVAAKGGQTAAQILRASITLRNAQERLAAAEQHLADVRAKEAAKPPKNQAQLVRQQQELEHALDRVAKAQQHLNDVQALAAARSSSSGAAKATSNANELAAAQRRLAAAQEAVTKAGIPLSKGIEKTSNLFFDAKGNAKPLSEIFQILQDHTKNLTAEQRNLAFNIIFGNRAISSANILTKAGAKGFEEFSKAMGSTTAAEVARKRLDNLSGAWKIFKSSIQTALIQAGTPAQTPLKELVKVLTSLVNAFASLPSWVQSVLSGLTLLFGVIVGGLGGFILFVSFMAKAVRAFREFKAAMMFIKDLKLVQTAIEGLGVAMDFLAANPVILIIAAVIALVAALIYAYKHSETFRKVVQAVGHGIMQAFGAVVTFLKPVGSFIVGLFKDIGRIAGEALGFIEKHWRLLASVILLILGPLGIALAIFLNFGKIKKVLGDVLGAAVDFGKKIFNFFATPIKKAIDAVISFFSQSPNRIAYELGYVIGRVVKFVFDFYKTFYVGLYNIILDTIHFIGSLPEKIGNLLLDVITAVVNFYVMMYSTAIRWGVKIFNAIINFFIALPGRVAHYGSLVLNAAVKWLTQTALRAYEFGKKVYDNIVHFVSSIPGKVADFISSVPGKVLGFLAKVGSAATSIGSSIYHGVADFLDKLPKKMSDILSNITTLIKNAIKDAFTAMASWAGSLWDGFKHGLGIKSPSYIEKAMTGIVKSTRGSTKELSDHLRVLNGISRSLPRMPIGATAVYGAGPAQIGGRGSSSTTFNNTFNNPIAEKGSDSISRRLSSYANLGVVSRPRKEYAQ